MQHPTPILLTLDYPVANIQLNRPEKRNALNEELMTHLIQALQQIKEDDDIRVVVISGNGASFCAGADLESMRLSLQLTHEQNIEQALTLAHLLAALDTFPKPIIAAIHGPVYGGGIGLVATADIVIAATDTSFCFSEVKLGLMPAMISPYVLRAIGSRQARRYFVTAEVFDVDVANAMGLVHDVVASEQLLSTTSHLAELIANNGPQAVQKSKALIRDITLNWATLTPEQWLNKTATLLADIRVSSEGQAGVTAFLNKQKPSWSC